jgi:hypothetical protein
MADTSYDLTKKSFLNNVAKTKQSFAAEVFDGIWDYLSSNKFRELIYVVLQVLTIVMKIPFIQVTFPVATIISKILAYVMPYVKPTGTRGMFNIDDLPSADLIAEAVKADLTKELKQK